MLAPRYVQQERMEILVEQRALIIVTSVLQGIIAAAVQISLHALLMIIVLLVRPPLFLVLPVVIVPRLLVLLLIVHTVRTALRVR